MSRASRSYSQTGVYHILFRGVNQQNIFEEKADYEKLKSTILTVKKEMGFEIYRIISKQFRPHQTMWSFIMFNKPIGRIRFFVSFVKIK